MEGDAWSVSLNCRYNQAYNKIALDMAQRPASESARSTCDRRFRRCAFNRFVSTDVMHPAGDATPLPRCRVKALYDGFEPT